MLINYTVKTGAKSFTMLTSAWPDEALASCLDRFRDASVKANGGLIEQVASKIAVMANLQDRRDAVASVPSDYQEEVKKRVIDLFNGSK
jgi:hypothetical protein